MKFVAKIFSGFVILFILLLYIKPDAAKTVLAIPFLFVESVSNEVKAQKYSNILQRAITEKDYKICKEVETNNYSNDPIVWCYEQFIEAIADEKLCEITEIKAQDFQFSCYKTIALVKKDESFCAHVIKQSDKKDCYNEVASAKENMYYDKATSEDDINGCNKAGSRENDCIKTIAYNIQNPDLCSKISVNTEDISYGSCAGEIANSSRDIRICENIKKAIDKEKCFEFALYAGVYEYKDKFCEKFKLSTEAKDKCYLALVKSKHYDEKFCSYIKDSHQKELCLEEEKNDDDSE